MPQRRSIPKGWRLTSETAKHVMGASCPYSTCTQTIASLLDVPFVALTPQALVPPRAEAIAGLPTTHTRQVASCPPVTSNELPWAIARQLISPRCPPVPEPSSGSLAAELTRCTRRTLSQYPQLRIVSKLPADAVHRPKHECTRPIFGAGTARVPSFPLGSALPTRFVDHPDEAGNGPLIFSASKVPSLPSVRWVVGQEGSSSERGALTGGTWRLGADVRANTLLMCSE